MTDNRNGSNFVIGGESYFSIFGLDTEPSRSADTESTEDTDQSRGEWPQRVSKSAKPSLLFFATSAPFCGQFLVLENRVRARSYAGTDNIAWSGNWTQARQALKPSVRAARSRFLPMKTRVFWRGVAPQERGEEHVDALEKEAAKGGGEG
jgi:hypothetical protein